MYDFINLAPDTYFKYWENNAALEFIGKHVERTGEILPCAKVAHDKNLEFKLIPSKKDPGFYHCNLSGSIHKYNNQGRHNADSFHYYEFINQINHLKKTYDIDPTRTRVKSFEYGVNFELPKGITPKQFIDSIICMPTKRFIRMDAKRVDFGKITQFFDYDLKAYYKADQMYNDLFNKPIDIPHNTVRIEMRIKKMRFLEQGRYKLKEKGKTLHLSDLMKKEFTQGLGKILLDLISQIIFYDPKINMEHLTHRQQMRMMNFQNPMFWENIDNKERYKQQPIFKKYLSRCNHAHIPEKIHAAVEDKIKQLLSGNDQKGVQMHQKNLPCKYHKLGINAPYLCRVNSSPPLNPIEKSKKNRPVVKRFCKTCGRDITHQRKGSVYCSEKIYGAAGKKCRNTGLYQKRKTKRQRLIEKENKVLEKLLKVEVQPTQRLNLTLNTDQRKRPTINQVIAWPWTERRTIIKLKIQGYTLTRSRAKKYVKYLRELELCGV